ncbi:MAG: hypothetical protein QM813_02970 [Verrucomicrobiota bacterium]
MIADPKNPSNRTAANNFPPPKRFSWPGKIHPDVQVPMREIERH